MKKPIYYLLGILLIFVIVYFLLIQKEKKTFAPGKVENFLQLDSTSVNQIAFKKFDTKLIFQKVNQAWYMIEPESCRVDNQAVGQLLSAASHLEVGEVISSNREKQSLFMVDDFTGTRLDFFAGERQLASLVLGTMSPDFLQAYLRKANSDDVYLAKGFFTRLAERKVDQWKNRTLFTFNPKQIKEIELSQSKERFKLIRQDTTWQLSWYPYQESSPADAKMVEDYIQSLASMKADEFAKKTDIEGIDFNKTEFLLTLTFLDGHEEKLLATRKMEDESRYFVTVDQDKSVYALFEYTFKRLEKKPEDFLLNKSN